MSRVSLVGMTKPSSITGCNTAEQLVAYAARVSNPENQNNTKTAPKLLKYLIREGHWSPFEIVHITMEIVTLLVKFYVTEVLVFRSSARGMLKYKIILTYVKQDYKIQKIDRIVLN